MIHAFSLTVTKLSNKDRYVSPSPQEKGRPMIKSLAQLQQPILSNNRADKAPSFSSVDCLVLSLVDRDKRNDLGTNRQASHVLVFAQIARRAIRTVAAPRGMFGLRRSIRRHHWKSHRCNVALRLLRMRSQPKRRE